MGSNASLAAYASSLSGEEAGWWASTLAAFNFNPEIQQGPSSNEGDFHFRAKIMQSVTESANWTLICAFSIFIHAPEKHVQSCEWVFGCLRSCTSSSGLHRDAVRVRARVFLSPLGSPGCLLLRLVTHSVFTRTRAYWVLTDLWYDVWRIIQTMARTSS